MADYTKYPLAADIEVQLKSLGAWPTNSTAQALAAEQASIAAKGASDEWERRTGWHPFLKGDADVTRVFEKTTHRGILELNSGLLELTSIVVGTQTYTANDQFRLLDMNGSSISYPYTSIHFRIPVNSYSTRPIWGRQISVTAKWGFAFTMPGDAWQAILRYGTANMLSQVENVQDLVSLSQDGFSKSIGASGVVTAHDLFQGRREEFNSIASLYTRVVV